MTKRKIKDTHAAIRLVQRYSGEMSMDELRKRVHDGNYTSHLKQTCTRSLCSVKDAEGRWVFFILNRKRHSIVTVLSAEQAQSQFNAHAREWPPPEPTEEFVVELVTGPPNPWTFAVRRAVDARWTFCIPEGVGIDSELVLQEAWESAPEPNLITQVELSRELQYLLTGKEPDNNKKKGD